MCGRYALYGPSSRNSRHFGLQAEMDLGDHYNIAPSQLAPVIRVEEGGHRSVLKATWGLRPGWLRDSARTPAPINARAETAAQRPMFRTAFRRFRVLVPASGFYEWRTVAGGKQPYYFRIRGDEPMAFGGLLERREGADGVEWSYCILTTEPNSLLAPIHNRMPVIIDPAHYAHWLDPQIQEPERVSVLIGPYPVERMEGYPVGKSVGNPRSQGPGLVEPIRGAD